MSGVASGTEEAARLRVLGVIPARLSSSRLPRKVLREIAGRPLLAWVMEAAEACPLFDRLVVAVDSDEVAALCERSGWEWQMTSPALASGTDRLYAVAQRIPAEIYVNIQGDEPLLTGAHFQALLAPFERPAVDAATLKVPCPPADVSDPNVVMRTAGRRCDALRLYRKASWSVLSGWNSCGCWRTGCGCMSPRRRRMRSG